VKSDLKLQFANLKIQVKEENSALLVDSKVRRMENKENGKQMRMIELYPNTFCSN
jgi:hypothetical protein